MKSFLKRNWLSIFFLLVNGGLAIRGWLAKEVDGSTLMCAFGAGLMLATIMWDILAHRKDVLMTQYEALTDDMTMKYLALVDRYVKLINSKKAL